MCPRTSYQPKSNTITLTVRNPSPYVNTRRRHSVAPNERTWTIVKTSTIQGLPRKYRNMATGVFFRSLLWKWSGVGNKSKVFSSSYSRLTNHITKILSCRKSKLFCGKWPTIKVVIRLRKAAEENHPELALVTAHCRLWLIDRPAAVFQFLGVSVIWR